MSRRRKLSFIESRMLRSAKRDGWKTYRYGSSAPVTLPRIFTGEARRHMVDKVLDVLRDWRQSPFEHEGPTRAGIRAGLCLEGHGWQQADNEAEALVAESLHRMGAKRPNWEEGQPWHTIGRDNCMNCRGPLDDEDIANHRRFCCDECATAARRSNEQLFQRAMRLSYHSAYYVATKEALPEKDCEWCGILYKPAQLEQRFCSKSCAQNVVWGDRKVKPKPCLHCGNLFKGVQVEQKFCSNACRVGYVAEHGSLARLPEQHCGYCKAIFRPKNAGAKYCSRDCALQVRYAAQRAATAAKKVPKPCGWCGQEFQPNSARAMFCCKDCNDKAQKAKKKARREASTFTCEEVKEAA